MDFIKDLTGGNKEGEQSKNGQTEKKSGGGGFMDKLNNAAGGGAAGEKKEDGLDKGWLSHLLSIQLIQWDAF